ncbi:hypothetical protein TNCV_428321 [Trichonephila clavipes]|nr:hypothetical protein TNCV_428321 [Trichonephila clavipes]
MVACHRLFILNTKFLEVRLATAEEPSVSTTWGFPENTIFFLGVSRNHLILVLRELNKLSMQAIHSTDVLSFRVVDGSLCLSIWTDTQSSIPYQKVFDMGHGICWNFPVCGVECMLIAWTMGSGRRGLRRSSGPDVENNFDLVES